MCREMCDGPGHRLLQEQDSPGSLGRQSTTADSEATSSARRDYHVNSVRTGARKQALSNLSLTVDYNSAVRHTATLVLNTVLAALVYSARAPACVN